MNRTVKLLVLPVMALALTGVPSFAQDHPDHDNSTYRQHSEWKPGAKIEKNDWDRGEKVDYKAHHLRKPPEGHEWRMVDGHFVMASPDGRIVSVRKGPSNNHQKSPDQHPQ